MASTLSEKLIGSTQTSPALMQSYKQTDIQANMTVPKSRCAVRTKRKKNIVGGSKESEENKRTNGLLFRRRIAHLTKKQNGRR